MPSPSIWLVPSVRAGVGRRMQLAGLEGLSKVLS
jgi:hypothetical protein